MLFFNPFGGSFVILIPDYKTAGGKSPEGYDVNHNLKFVLIFLASVVSSSTIFSNYVIHFTAK